MRIRYSGRVCSGTDPDVTACVVNAANSAAAGAHGADINPGAPPASAAINPMIPAPIIPETAPRPANSGPIGAKIISPKAIADGRATSIDANPPKMSEDEADMFVFVKIVFINPGLIVIGSIIVKLKISRE